MLIRTNTNKQILNFCWTKKGGDLLLLYILYVVRGSSISLIPIKLNKLNNLMKKAWEIQHIFNLQNTTIKHMYLFIHLSTHSFSHSFNYSANHPFQSAASIHPTEMLCLSNFTSYPIRSHTKLYWTLDSVQLFSIFNLLCFNKNTQFPMERK